MKKRYTVLGISAFLALALTVPALGGPSNPVAHTASALSKAKKAIGLANAAQATATGAQNTANTANTTANAARTAAATAQTTANQAKTAADNAQASANAAQVAADNANANANTRLLGTTARFGTATANAAGPQSTSVACNAGEVPTGGGFSIGGTAPRGASVQVSEDTFYNTGWFVSGDNIAGQATAWSLQAMVECAHP